MLQTKARLSKVKKIWCSFREHSHRPFSNPRLRLRLAWPRSCVLTIARAFRTRSWLQTRERSPKPNPKPKPWFRNGPQYAWEVRRQRYYMTSVCGIAKCLTQCCWQTHDVSTGPYLTKDRRTRDLAIAHRPQYHSHQVSTIQVLFIVITPEWAWKPCTREGWSSGWAFLHN